MRNECSDPNIFLKPCRTSHPPNFVCVRLSFLPTKEGCSTQAIPELAKTIERAEQAATQNGLVIVGVLDSIYIDDSESEHMNMVGLNEDKIVH